MANIQPINAYRLYSVPFEHEYSYISAELANKSCSTRLNLIKLTTIEKKNTLQRAVPSSHVVVHDALKPAEGITSIVHRDHPLMLVETNVTRPFEADWLRCVRWTRDLVSSFGRLPNISIHGIWRYIWNQSVGLWICEELHQP